RAYVLGGFGVLLAAAVLAYFWAKRESSRETLDKWKSRFPGLGEIWTKYQVAQLSRVLGTLLTGGIPLVQALETTGRSLGTVLMRKALDRASVLVREGGSLSKSLKSTGI